MKKWLIRAVMGMAMLATGRIQGAEAVDPEAVQDQQEELRSTLGNLTQQLNAFKQWSDNGPKLEVNVDLRLDAQRYKSATINAAAAGPKAGAFKDGGNGMYAKRTELKVKEIGRAHV